MRLIMVLAVGGEPDVVSAQIAFHLHAGVDLVLATPRSSHNAFEETLDSFLREGSVHVLPDPVDGGQRHWGERGAATAVTEHGADWVVVCEPGEFWWPRGPSLKEILTPIPNRYSVVRGLVRQFVRGGDSEGFVIRRALRSPADLVGAPEDALRPIYRARPAFTDARNLDTRLLVPLRAWYPAEVFRLPRPGEDELPADEVEQGLEEGWLVVDSRLRDALRTLGGEPTAEEELQAGNAGKASSKRIVFPTPHVADDAAYAIECAAVGEVDLDRFEQRLDELENRLAGLERGFWPRVAAGLSRGRRRRQS